MANVQSSVSSDRLERFKSKLSIVQTSSNQEKVSCETDIQIGNWAIFKNGKKKLLGQILSISYSNGKKFYEETAPIKKSLKELCSWFELSIITPSTTVSVVTYVNISNYLVSVPAPSLVLDQLAFNAFTMKQINDNLY